MLKLFKDKKAQNTAEYAILIALVVGGVIAMQTYAQRALQARLRDASVHMRDTTNSLGNSLQYEPYYSESTATTTKDSTSETTEKGVYEQTNVSKAAGAMEKTTYNKNAGAVTGLSTTLINAGF